MLAYFMIPMMQRELDEFRLTIWNTHRIRAQKETLMADGIPDHIFEFPERYGNLLLCCQAEIASRKTTAQRDYL